MIQCSVWFSAPYFSLLLINSIHIHFMSLSFISLSYLLSRPSYILTLRLTRSSFYFSCDYFSTFNLIYFISLNFLQVLRPSQWQIRMKGLLKESLAFLWSQLGLNRSTGYRRGELQKWSLLDIICDHQSCVFLFLPSARSCRTSTYIIYTSRNESSFLSLIFAIFFSIFQRVVECC